jgi:hypothetical protein
MVKFLTKCYVILISIILLNKSLVGSKVIDTELGKKNFGSIPCNCDWKGAERFESNTCM